ncbi:MAG: hypothetical protein ABI395_06455 [Sphingobium sp.]
MLPDRAAALGERRAQGQRDAIAGAVQNDFPGVTAHVEGDAVVLEGRHLLERWLRDARLRNVGRDVLRSGGGQGL